MIFLSLGWASIYEPNGKVGDDRFVVNVPVGVAVEKVREKVEQEKRTAEERLYREQDDCFILKTKLTLKY